MIKRKKLQRTLAHRFGDSWPVVLSSIAATLLAVGILWFALGTLVPGLSSSELNHVERVQNDAISLRHTLTQDPLFMPFTLGLYVLQLFELDSAVALRSISAIFGLLSIGAVYLIIRRWHTPRIALFMTVLYATSAPLLHTARHADVASTYLLLPVIIAAILYVRSTGKTWAQLLLYGLAIGLLLAIPGAVWLVALLIMWQRKRLLGYVRKINAIGLSIIIAAAVVLAGLLGYAFIAQPELILPWLGITETAIGVSGYLRSVGSTVGELFLRGPGNDPRMWVGIAPLTDALVTVLFLLGVYVALLQRKLERHKVIFTVMGVLVLLSGLSQYISAYAVMPFIYIVASAGLALLLQQWFTVFPRNPIARNTGVILVLIVASFSVYYNMHRYFEAWPKTPAVRAEFHHREE